MAVREPINIEVATYLRAVQPFVDLWTMVTHHAVDEMTLTPAHWAIGTHAEDLQTLYRGALAIEVPSRCYRAHAAFLAVIASTIAAYLLTAEQRRDDQAHSTMLRAFELFSVWRGELARLQQSMCSSN